MKESTMTIARRIIEYLEPFFIHFIYTYIYIYTLLMFLYPLYIYTLAFIGFVSFLS